MKILLLILFFVFLFIIPMWKINEKAGQPGWACIIPIYNLIILLQIAKKPLWWILLLCTPYLNLVFVIWIWNRISKGFGKDEAFTIGLVLLGFIFIPILGYGDAQYDPNRLD